MRARFPGAFELALWFCGALVLLFVVAPLAGMVFRTSGACLAETAADEAVQRSIRLTLLSALGAAAACSIVAVPFAYWLARRDFPGKRLLLAIIDLPVVIPHSTAGIALLGVLNRDALPGRVAEWFGLSIVGHPIGIATAMAFVSLPFLVSSAREGFAAVPEELEKAALTLGASPQRVFWTIALPMARHAVLTGLVMMFARGLSEFGAVMVIAYYPMVTPVLIYERFTAFGLKYARGVAVFFLGASLMTFLFLRVIPGRRRHRA